MDRKEYMRNYMKRRRDKEKGGVNSVNVNSVNKVNVNNVNPDVRLDMVVERIEELESKIDGILRVMAKNGVYVDD